MFGEDILIGEQVMKKIFRMQYEPCLGTCYAYDDILMLEINKLKENKKDLNKLLKCLESIHDRTCGNTEIGFTLDYDENMFIGTFVSPDNTQSFCSPSLIGCYEKFVQILNWYSETHNIYKDKSVCDHGREENIVKFTLEKAGLYLGD